MRRPAVLLLVLLLLVLGACGDGDGDDAGTDTRLADVAVWIDDEPLGIERACDGADGAVVVDTVDGRRVILVREGGAVAIRLFTDDRTWDETAEIEVTRIGEVRRHEARVRIDGTAIAVRLEVRDSVDLPV